MSRYRLSRSARKDLEEIWFAAATKESVDFATGVIDEISQRFPMLAGMPGSGRLRPEIDPDLRSFPVGDYIIYYRKPRRGEVQISGVLHGKRNQLKAIRGAKGLQ